MSAAVALPWRRSALLDPNAEGHYPTCPVRGVLGVDCPGVGACAPCTTWLHGDVVGALDHNALMILVLPLLVWSWLAGSRAGRRGLVRWDGTRPMAALVVLSWVDAAAEPAMFPLDVLGSGAGDWA